MRGSCLCGGVGFEAKGKVLRFSIDHCSRCKKATGSAFGVWLIVEREGFSWLAGEALVTRYVAPVRHTPPGYPRTFCLVCGGPVPYVDEGFVGIPAGILDDDPGVRPEGHIFSEMKAPWLEMDDTLPHICGGPTPPAQS